MFVCFSHVLEKLLACIYVGEPVEHTDLDLSILNSNSAPVEPTNQVVARGKKKSIIESISTGKSFWQLRENISHCRKTCIPIPASEYFIIEVNFL
jgi:hypothetical protein